MPVYRLSDGILVVDLQTDLIGVEASRIVAPLRLAAKYARFPGLTPTGNFADETWIVRIQELAAVAASELGQPLGALAVERDKLKRAVDILFDGC